MSTKRLAAKQNIDTWSAIRRGKWNQATGNSSTRQADRYLGKKKKREESRVSWTFQGKKKKKDGMESLQNEHHRSEQEEVRELKDSSPNQQIQKEQRAVLS